MYQGDILVASAGANFYPIETNNPAVNLTLSILESVNIP
jgi:hypothetical protein